MKKLLELIVTVSSPIIIINTIVVIAALLWVIFVGGWHFTLVFIGVCVVCVNTVLIGVIIIYREGQMQKYSK